MKRLIGSLFLLAFILGNSLAHSGKPKYHVIIDTDGAMDDMRAISMLLSGNDIRVLAITCSQGTLYPEQVLVKVKSLLSAFHHEGIPVGVSERSPMEPPSWASTALDFKWAEENYIQNSIPHRNSIELLNKVVEDYPEKVILIALGSLKTYAAWINANGISAEKADRIIWYNNHSIHEGFNFQVSPASYRSITRSDIPLEILANNSDHLCINMEYISQIRLANSIYARQIVDMHARASASEKPAQAHMRIWDDLVPLYLVAPILFDMEKDSAVKLVSMSQHLPQGFVYESISKLLASATRTNNRVFIAFPTDTALYKPAYARMLKMAIAKFGLIEWKAVTMTNEIHGHTGIYSIIGAKMGIRAMEYFNVGVNNLEVSSFAGSKPPLSCFNDGIQISTGATIGQGLISISDSTSAVPSALFTFNNQKVQIRLKKEIADQMQHEIAFGIENYGLLSDNYWLYIEELALEYWEKYDRQNIFQIEMLQ